MTDSGPERLTELKPRIDAWLEAAIARQAPLTFRDIRKGVQALSQRYVERRNDEAALTRVLDSPARRAAFATYYAALHLMQAVLAARAFETFCPTARIVDLGAGTGAVGLGASLALDTALPVVAYDRSGWALAEARHAARDWGIPLRTRRQDLARGLPRFAAGDGVVVGWTLNELPDKVRGEALETLRTAARNDTPILLLEPLAGAIAPWWDDAVADLGLRAIELRARPERPRFIADMDRAAGLDHAELRLRVAGPRG